MILFEIVDFIGNIRPSISVNNWHRIAWAFIKPIGSNGIINIGKQIRLQLYKPRAKPKAFDDNQPIVSNFSAMLQKPQWPPYH